MKKNLLVSGRASKDFYFLFYFFLHFICMCIKFIVKFLSSIYFIIDLLEFYGLNCIVYPSPYYRHTLTAYLTYKLIYLPSVCQL